MNLNDTFNQPLSEGIIQPLLTHGLLNAATAQDIISAAAQANRSIVKHIVEKGILSARSLMTLASEEYGVPCLDIEALEPSVIDLSLLSEKLIEKHHVLPLFKRNNILFLAVSDPSQQSALNEIKLHTGLSIRTIVVDSDKLDRLTQEVLNQKNSLSLTDTAQNSSSFNFEIAEEEHSGNEGKEEQEDAPTVRFVNQILLEAIGRRASDIHFEPYDKDYRIRFRIDGLLYEIAHPPLQIANRISTRLKILAQLDISEKRVPQDGRFKLKTANKNPIDFRMSSCPTVNGEKLVIRILDPGNTKLDIDKLGFNEAQKTLFLNCVSKPQGMILVTGPTGSGKTVTLYTALHILNTAYTNISTAEDPVEIKMNGINQVQINSKAGLTFASCLRSFLRQDPDIIMVGEIRDLETAEVAIKAAQTGHLVLSTLHTNSAAETLTRLSNMGIDSFNIVNTVTLIISQRLIRRLCDKCKTPLKIDKDILLSFGFSESEIGSFTVFGPNKCKDCTEGYKGRIGLFELLGLNNDIYELILKKASSIEVERAAINQGMISLKQSALEKVRLGLTSLEEINFN